MSFQNWYRCIGLWTIIALVRHHIQMGTIRVMFKIIFDLKRCLTFWTFKFVLYFQVNSINMPYQYAISNGHFLHFFKIELVLNVFRFLFHCSSFNVFIQMNPFHFLMGNLKWKEFYTIKYISYLQRHWQKDKFKCIEKRCYFNLTRNVFFIA